MLEIVIDFYKYAGSRALSNFKLKRTFEVNNDTIKQCCLGFTKFLNTTLLHCLTKLILI